MKTIPPFVLLASLISFASFGQGSNPFPYGAVVAPPRINSPRDLETLQRYNRRMSAAEFEKLLTTNKLSYGQAYFSPDWRPGSVTLDNGRKYNNVTLRYNIVLDQIDVRDSINKEVTKTYTPAQIAGFSIIGVSPNKYNFEELPYNDVGAQKETIFFQVLNNGPVRLLLLHAIDEVPPIRNEALDAEIRPAQYNRIIRLFYIKPGMRKAQELELTRKAVLRLFDKEAKSMEAYATSKGILYNQLPSVYDLVEHYNSLNIKK